MGLVSFWMGADGLALGKLFAENGFEIPASKLPAAGAALSLGFMNAALGKVERLIYKAQIEKTEIRFAPLFVLGHWRSGTTWLHELLTLDPRHNSPSTYQCLSPCHFLLTESWLPRVARALLPATRPADNMKLSWERPQEDEFALLLLGVPSPYRTMAFPERPSGGEYLDFEGLSQVEIARWEESFLELIRRITYRDPRRLVLKSPTHTARVRYLKKLFPEAKFIHIVRDPCRVFVSTMKLWTSMYESQGFGRFDLASLEEHVFRTYVRVFERFEEDRKLLSGDALHELKYEDLVRDPIGEVRKLYEKLELGGFDEVKTKLEAYGEASRSYETNRYDVTNELRRKISRRWSATFQRYGYPVG